MQLKRYNELEFIPASHEDPKTSGVFKKVLFSKNDFQGRAVQMINWALLPAGASFRKHYHEDMEEVFVIVRGQASLQVGEQSVTLAPGDSILIPAKTAHEMHNRGGDEVHYVVVGITSERNGKTIVLA